MRKTLDALVVKKDSSSMKALIEQLKKRKAQQIAALRKQMLCAK